MPVDSKDSRTTPLGLFNYARSYWLSAEHLHSARLRLTHAHAPVTYLFYHAVELYLKAFLRCHGLGLAHLRRLGHDTRALRETALKKGIYLMDEDEEVLELMASTDATMRSRYIETGFFTRPSEEALQRTCKSLDETVSRTLRAAGISVRRRA